MAIAVGDVVEDDVLAGFEEMVRLVGQEVTYRRFKEMSGSPSGGYDKVWWEEPTFDALVGSVNSWVVSQDSRMEQSDRKLIFKTSEFTSQASDDDALPRSGDEITLASGNVWTTELEDDTIWEELVDGALYRVIIRRKQ